MNLPINIISKATSGLFYFILLLSIILLISLYYYLQSLAEVIYCNIYTFSYNFPTISFFSFFCDMHIAFISIHSLRIKLLRTAEYLPVDITSYGTNLLFVNSQIHYLHLCGRRYRYNPLEPFFLVGHSLGYSLIRRAIALS